MNNPHEIVAWIPLEKHNRGFWERRFAAGAGNTLPLQISAPGILCGVSQGESKQLFREGYSFGWFCIQKNSARTTENTLRYEVRGQRKILESTRQHLKCAITRSMTTRW